MTAVPGDSFGSHLRPDHPEWGGVAASGRPQPPDCPDGPQPDGLRTGFAYELAVIVCDGLRRMYQEQEDVFTTSACTTRTIRILPCRRTPGQPRAFFGACSKVRPGKEGLLHRAQLMGSGAILQQALKAQPILERYGVSADVWSVTSFKRLRSEAQAARRWNMLHPEEPARRSYLEEVVAPEQGPWVAVSDNLKLVADQIAPLDSGRVDPAGNRWIRPQRFASPF